MSASHIVVQLSHGTSARDVTVLLVQVVLVGCAAVSQPNAVVLDVARIALRNLLLYELETIISGAENLK